MMTKKCLRLRNLVGMMRESVVYAAAVKLYKPENRTGDVSEFRQGLTDNNMQ